MPPARNSRAVRLVVGSTRSTARLTSKVLLQMQQVEDRQHRQARYEANISGLSTESQTMLTDMQHEPVDSTATGADDTMGAVDDDFQWETVPDDLRDNETFMLAVRDIVGSQWRVYKDQRGWRQRLIRLHANWAPIVSTLTSGYLKWKYSPPPEDSEACPYDFSINVINIYTLVTTANIRSAATVETAAEALVLSGYLGATPHSPTIAISLSTLKLYRRLRLRKPSLSIEAFTKVICDLYHWPYRRRYCTALADTFNIYLTIHHNIDAQVSKALGHDTENWHVLNACPPCTYELKDELELIYCCMIVFDGNNSLSRMVSLGGREVGDTRKFQSDYYLEPGYIDIYASQSNAPSSDDENLDPTSRIPTGEDPGPSNTSQPTSACTDNWKAAAADAKKKLWGIFEEMGVFTSACRHVLTTFEFSFKYPLAIVSRALETLGPCLLIGYDVGCKLAVTIASSTLAQKFIDAEYRMYTHSYACQDQNHPNVINGMGIKDLATMERIFSSSNQLAAVTRYASAFNRRVYIDSFFKQWDEDKYLNLGNMLYRNYIQARQIIDEQQIAVREAKTLLGISDNDIKTWSLEQSHYLATTGHEAEWDIHAVAYVELLQKLREARVAAENASTLFLNAMPLNYEFVTPSTTSTSYTTNLSQTRKLETQCRHTNDRYDLILQDVVALELKMGIVRRWELADQQYLATLKYMSQCEYHHALNNLQRLVVLCLFELHKLNISQMGYRMRTHIAKSLQTRCKSIQNAVKSYNTAALALDPPAPTLDWSKVSHYNFLEEFVLLCETRQDIRSKCWAEPAVREVMKQSLHIERAHEEIHRCNVESRWLHTYIVDEERHFTQVISKAKSASDNLSGALEEFCQHRRRINAHVLAHLQDLYSLDGFTGSSIPGVSKNAQDVAQTSVDVDLQPLVDLEHQSAEADENNDCEELEEDDATAGEVGGLLNYISELP
ncbi:hypothetical protein F4604DRAFT_1680819 [Suillus subluteus]|nr:hypothetical protein F4604DRAFT_1680819 [Suillus subluteus]